jgi:Trichohyalin-plectin-homology domain
VQRQILDRQEEQVAARVEFEKERDAVDAVMAAIEEEDRLQEALKRAKAAETMRYVHDFVADRDARRAAERKAEFEAERKIQVRRTRRRPQNTALWAAHTLAVRGCRHAHAPACAKGAEQCQPHAVRLHHAHRCCGRSICDSMPACSHRRVWGAGAPAGGEAA